MHCNAEWNCVSEFTGLFCETCPHFIRTGMNIELVRNRRSATIEEVQKSVEHAVKYEAEMQAETDKVCNDYCTKKKAEQNQTDLNEYNEQNQAKKEAEEYAEYLRLKAKYEP